MANHCVVKTLDPMTHESVSAVLERLNSRVFEGLVRFTDSPSGCQPRGWLVRVDGPDYPLAERQCWLDGDRHFEMRHGGGTEFAWWVDQAITNEIACEYRGLVWDEGIPEHPGLGVVGSFDDPSAYLEWSVKSDRPDYRRFLLIDRLDGFPAVLRARAEAGLWSLG